MLGISPEVMVHLLEVDPLHQPMKQKKRNFIPEWQKATVEEVDKLTSIGFIRKVNYTEWLANVVPIKKTNGKWRMCIDFTNLIEAYPKIATHLLALIN